MKRVIIALVICIFSASGVFAENKFFISSSDFQNEGNLPAWSATPVAGGKNISPEIRWENPPSDTKSFALTVIDEHPVANRWVHWIVINIPSDVSELPRGASRKSLPSGAKELFNSYGFLGYGGPQPPPGTGMHKYVFTLYALSVPHLSVPSKITADEFEKRIAPYVIKKAVLIGFFGR